MTVQATPNFISYVGDNAQTVFNFTFRVDDLSWVSVDFTDDIDSFALNADQDNSPGGNLTYLVAPPMLQFLTITRATPVDQNLNYTRYDPFDSESTEDSIDKLTMAIQDLGDTVSNLIAAGTLQGSILRFDTTIAIPGYVEFGPNPTDFLLPDADGTAGQVMTTDGLGNLSWIANVTAPAGNPAGADGDLQYNNAGVFGALPVNYNPAGNGSLEHANTLALNWLDDQAVSIELITLTAAVVFAWPQIDSFTYQNSNEYQKTGMNGVRFNNDGTRIYRGSDAGLNDGQMTSSVVYGTPYTPIDTFAPVSVTPVGDAVAFFDLAWNADGTGVIVGRADINQIEERVNNGPAYNPGVGDIPAIGNTYATGSRPHSVEFSPDGLRMYHAQATPFVHESVLTVPYDISTAGVVSDIATVGRTMYTVRVAPDGLKAYIGTTAFIYEYDLGVAYDLTTIVDTGRSIATVDGILTSHPGFDVSPDGKTLVTGSQWGNTAANNDTARWTSPGSGTGTPGDFTLGDITKPTVIEGQLITLNGSLASNLLDKTVDEVITGNYTFNGDFLSLSAMLTNITMGAINGAVSILQATPLILFDLTNSANVSMSHDAADFNIVGGGGAVDINITGYTALNAGTLDVDFDAITATSYGGIPELDLLNKMALETVNARWTFVAGISMSDTELLRPTIRDYCIDDTPLVVAANAVTVDFTASNSATIDLEAATGTVAVTISGGPPAGTLGEMVIRVQQDTTADRVLTWAGGVFIWAVDGLIVDPKTGSDAITTYYLSTWDGGTTWYISGVPYGV